MKNQHKGTVSYVEEGMNVTMPLPIINDDILEDVQGQRDTREIEIEQVGVNDLKYPISVLDKSHEKQETVANIALSVGLPHDAKGTHMSRFIEVLEQHSGELTIRTIPAILREMKTRLDAESAQIEVSFPYFLKRKAPVSEKSALVEYQCTFVGEMSGDKEDFILEVLVPVTSLCPCSKTISNYGAHNQRGTITMRVRSDEIVWIEELIDWAEKSASSPVYALLKREDLRFLTMHAYDNPVFVEDMVRNIAVRLRDDSRITWFRVKAENQESIHNHNAFAQVTWVKQKEE